MPSLGIPPSGLSFGAAHHSSSKSDSTMPTAIGLSLTDGVMEEMIRCVQNGKPIELSLEGNHPILSYGSKTQSLFKSNEQFPQDIYKSSHNPNSSTSAAMGRSTPTPNLAWLASLGIKHNLTVKKPMAKDVAAAYSTSQSAKTASTTSSDAALAQLQSSMAEASSKKAINTTKLIKSVIPGNGKKLGNKARFLSSTSRLNDTTRSMPSSPNLSGVGSPSLGPTSVPLSQQQAEQAKATRQPVVHLLAFSPMTHGELKMKIASASNNDIAQVLDKVATLNKGSGKYELSQKYYKELNVWDFNYTSKEDRQRAIDSTVRVYDKMRLGVSEPEWERLLPKEERGTGKCLSRLQARIAEGPVAKPPKINVEKAEDSGRDTPAGHDDGVPNNKNVAKLKGEAMSRSASQPPTTKPKKVGEKEAQAKRLLSNKPPKPKPAPSKKEKLAQKGGKVLSSQFVSESDDEDEYMQNANPAPKPAPKPSVKRSREEDEADTSDSSIPLSKKMKKDTTNHRISDASQSSRTSNTTAYSSHSSKNKGTSPHKSSPLASSPPTNASEFENTSGHTSSSASPAGSSTKNSRSPIHKRHQKSSSVTSSVSSTSGRSLTPDVMDLARRYRSYYPKYAELHDKVAKLGSAGRRDIEKEQELLDMHQRLVEMKRNIMAGIIEAH